MRALLRLTLRFLLGLALALGWIAFGAVTIAWLAEETGLLERVVVASLRRAAGPLGDTLAVQDVRLRWFEPSLELEGVQLGASGEVAFLRHVDVRARFAGSHGLEVARVSAWDGHVRITPDVADAWERWKQTPGGEPQGEPAHTPTLRIDDVVVAWETRGLGRIPLGRVSLELRDTRDGPVLEGRVVPETGRAETIGARGADPNGDRRADTSGARRADPNGARRAGGAGEITVRGRPVRSEPSGVRAFELDAWARAVPLSPRTLPDGGALAEVARHKPQGTLDLSLHARLPLDGGELPSASLRARVTDGTLELLDGELVASELGLELDARYAPSNASEARAWPRAWPRAWSGRAHARAKLNGAESEAWLALGPEAGPGRLAKAWLAAPELELKSALGEMRALPTDVVARWKAFEPRGAARLHLALEVPSDWTLDEPLASRARFALDARLDGRGGMTYHGWPSLADGTSDEGFPLPIDRVRGEVAFARDPGSARSFRVALFDLAGEHKSGPIRAHGAIEAQVHDPASAHAEHESSDIDLTLASERLAVDEYVDRALIGLRGVLDPDTTWRPYEPHDGELGVDLRLVREGAMRWLATDLAVRFRGVKLAWREGEPAIPATISEGLLRYRSDGLHQGGLSFTGTGALETARSLDVTLRAQFDPTASAVEHSRRLDELLWIDARVARLSLKGEDVQRLARRYPDAGASLAPVTRQGFADARYTRAHGGRDQRYASYFEIAPNADTPVAIQYEGFPMPTNDVRTTVRGAFVEEPGASSSTRISIAPLVGRWEKDSLVAIRFALPGRSVSVHGVGVDPSSAKLRGALRELLKGSGGGGGADISTANLSGRVDLNGEITLAEQKKGAERSRFRFHLRDNTFQSGKTFRLDDLRGVLTLVDEEQSGKRVEVLRGGRIEASLAGTPVVLSNTTLQSPSSGGLQFDTDLQAESIPIDKAHLAPFVDVDTLDALLGELKWSGTLAVPAGHVTLTAPSDGEGALVFRGDVVPSDMRIVLGMPLQIEAARARIEELVYEGGRVRAFASVEGMNGTAAGRRLEGASLLVTYVEPRLSIEDLKGKFARGEIRPLGVDSDRGGTLFSIDLAEPYPFQLAIDLRDVRLEDVLQGLFVSNVASKGRLDANLLLRGDTKNILAIEGAGSVRVRDSYLWSIPVFRGLLSRFGLGNAVVFDELATNINVHDGRIDMRDIVVRSDVIQLAGAGSLDFDGALDYQLDARLTEIKTLDWILRAVSFITDNIVSVSISGDLARPEITAHWFNLFGKDGRFRALPLPGYAPLPPRF